MTTETWKIFVVQEGAYKAHTYAGTLMSDAYAFNHSTNGMVSFHSRPCHPDCPCYKQPDIPNAVLCAALDWAAREHGIHAEVF